MFKKIKNWLGIEGVKIALELSEEFNLDDNLLEGKLVFSSLTDQKVSSVKIKLLEKYSRGTKDKQLMDEFECGSMFIDQEFEVKANATTLINFKLPIDIRKSELDRMAEQNFVLDGIVKVAKYFNKVSSQFRIEVNADVVGVRLDPVLIYPLEFESE